MLRSKILPAEPVILPDLIHLFMAGSEAPKLERFVLGVAIESLEHRSHNGALVRAEGFGDLCRSSSAKTMVQPECCHCEHPQWWLYAKERELHPHV